MWHARFISLPAHRLQALPEIGNADTGTVLDCGRGAVLTALADVHRLLERAAPQVKAAAGSVDGLRPKDLAAMSRKAG